MLTRKKFLCCVYFLVFKNMMTVIATIRNFSLSNYNIKFHGKLFPVIQKYRKSC